jgi:hypothetical protein
MTDASNGKGKRALTLLAWTNVIAHAIALVFAALGMRPGSPLVELPERTAHLARFPAGWSLGWTTWMLCAMVLVAFFVVLA